MFVDFHSVYERYSQDVYRFVCFLSGDASLAEEITQETFVRAWVTAKQIRVGTVKAYLFMIARNLYRAELKRARRHAVLDNSLPIYGLARNRPLTSGWTCRMRRHPSD